MILLSGHSLTPARKVPMEALSVTLTERDSTAQLTPADMTGIGVNSWLKDDDGNVWRVVSISQNYMTNTPTVQLEHVIHALQDRILFGEITPADITGSSSATTCTAKQAVQYILNQQSDFTLGTFDYNSVSNPYKFDGDTLYDAIEQVSNSLDGCMWTYDLTTYPFKLNIIQKPDTVACELRPGRNLQTISRTIDRSQMYTRFYPIGKDDLHISGNYVSRNENLYGIISKVETDTSLETTAELTAWANERLSKHAEPTVTITADALELAAATGESLDRLKLGWKCRIPLTEFNTTITETITRIQYRDKVHSPEVAQVTLANNRTDVTRILADAIKNTAKGGRGGARQEKEDHAWFEDTDTRVAMVVGTNSGGNYIKAGEIALAINTSTGQSTATINADHVNISSTSDAHLLSGSIVYDADGNLVLKESSGAGIVIERTEGTSTAQFGVFDDGNLTAGVIATKVNGVSSTNIYADKILMSSASGANNVQVEVNGKITANDITAQFINSLYASAGTFTCVGITASGNIVASGGVTGSGIYVSNNGSTVSISDPILDVKITDPVDNVYKLQYKSVSHQSWTDAGSFSRATALSGAWSSGKFTVSASPQGTTFWTNLVQGTVSWSGNTATVPVEAIDSDNQSYQYATGRSITVDATARYNAGKTDGNTAAGVTGSWGSGASANVYTVQRAANTSTKSLSCTVTAGASISYNSSTHKYTATGRAYGNASEKKSATAESGTEAYDAGYNAGWNACRAKMINDQYQSTFFTGREQLIMDYDGNNLWVIYPYQQTTITRYYVPDAR